MLKLLVAVDGSDPARRAIDAAAQQALLGEGLAAQEITRLALEHPVDQIVMGTRGRNLLGGLLLGSVAQRVVHLAAMPVLLVK